MKRFTDYLPEKLPDSNGKCCAALHEASHKAIDDLSLQSPEVWYFLYKVFNPTDHD